MTSSLSKADKRQTVTLTFRQVESIAYDMGWEDEDAEAFWQLALCEADDPGGLDRERAAFFSWLVRDDGGKQ